MPATYTYRGGQKVPLAKDQQLFTVMAGPNDRSLRGLNVLEEVSVIGTTVRTADMDKDMTRVRKDVVAHHLYRDEVTGEPWPMTDELVVTLEDEQSTGVLDDLINNYGLVLVQKLGSRDYVLKLTDDTGMNPIKLVVKLTEEKKAGLKYVEHNLQYRMKKYSGYMPPDDPLYAQQWHLHDRMEHPEVDPRSSSRCDGAWELLGHFGDPEVTICVLDDGCRMDHHDFNGPNKIHDWAYFDGTFFGDYLMDVRLVTSSDINADPNRMYQPNQNHGTSCCGVASAEQDSVLTVGAAPGCRLLPVKVLSKGAILHFSDTDFLTVIDYISDKVDVMSNSWGSSPKCVFIPQVLDRINSLKTSGGRSGKGILFLFAAGNENCPINYTAPMAVPYDNGWVRQTNGTDKWVGVNASKVFFHNLAELPGVLHVAALASTARRSHYSNYGPGVDICAPSSNGHTYHRMMVQGLGITTARGQTPVEVTERFGGTSSATPLVAGIAALVFSANPKLTAQQVRQILIDTAGKDLDLTPYPKTPAAVYDPDTSWDVSPIPPFDTGAFKEGWSPWFGYGKVDAEAAVRKAIAMRAEI